MIRVAQVAAVLVVLALGVAFADWYASRPDEPTSTTVTDRPMPTQEEWDVVRKQGDYSFDPPAEPEAPLWHLWVLGFGAVVTIATIITGSTPSPKQPTAHQRILETLSLLTHKPKKGKRKWNPPK